MAPQVWREDPIGVAREPEVHPGPGNPDPEPRPIRLGIRHVGAAGDPAEVGDSSHLPGLQRLGELEAAAEDANLCIEKEPATPESLYAAACVAALSARKLRSPQLREQAIEILKQAIACGTPRQKLLDDPDLSVLQNEAEFRKLTGEFD